jgi:hypothetical protein
MTKDSYRNMVQHVQILGWLYITWHLLGVLIAIVVFVTITGGGILSGDPDAIRITALVGTIIATFLLLLSVPGIVVGYGLLKRKTWARTLAIVLGILNLFNFPLGTALGVYTLWALMQDEVAPLFTPEKNF